ncbi:Z-ring formation inhibitor MciZ [Priestia taiwanensis]|uniref:Z-ring formation inhibitor MciZ n=1 Tax=Priestia taiwanensis TaxID=1347902 RepID=A0A917AJR7_9BACI|nr:Z-ring formation inhibitor MciZ [Priestia taiwanensis]MBM7361455.1 hypothetical protein [Priestia taiwanensis]GGE54265.1 hypothetical protein GCM10007140_00770 [Priestia taiwanensis]
MKIYLFEKSMTLVGKAWEIKLALKEYGKQHTTVQALLNTKKKET